MPQSFAAAWWDMCTANMTLAVRAGETAIAANTVIGSRLGTIGEAVRDPLAGDYAELSAMVTEKAAALAQAGASLAGDLHALQLEAVAAMAHLGALWTRGTPPGPRDARAIAARTTRIAAHATGAAGRAFAPVHARATANARRLGPKRKG